MTIKIKKPKTLEFTKDVKIDRVENYNPNAKVVNNNYFVRRGFQFEFTSFFSTLKSSFFY